MKRDDYLSTIMQVPPKQRIKITPFDPKTQRDAFTVSLEGLKGVRFFFYPIMRTSRTVVHSYHALLVESQRVSS